MTNKNYCDNQKIIVLSNIYGTNPSKVKEISKNKYRLGKYTYHIYTLHQLMQNEKTIPHHSYSIIYNYEQYFIIKNIKEK